MKPEIADDRGRLYSRRSYSTWTVQAVLLGQICLRSEPDSVSFVGVQLQATWFALSVDVVCAAWETWAQRVGVARLTTIMVLSVIGVEVWPHGMSIQQWNNVFGYDTKQPWRTLQSTENCTTLVLREWMIESDRLNMTWNQLRVVDCMENRLDRIVRSIWWSTVSNAALRSNKTRRDTLSLSTERTR